MTAKATAPKNTTHMIAKSIALGLFGLGLGLSVSHIYGGFIMLGTATVTAAAMPFFIDGVALLGRLARSDKFAASTRKTGLKVQIVAGTISLIANVVAGETWGDKIAGVFIVGGYVFAEWFADHLKPAEADVQRARATARSNGSVQAAATRKANAAARKAEAEAQAVAAAAKREAARSRRERKALDAKLADAEVVPAGRYI